MEKEEAALALAGLQEEQDTLREELEFMKGRVGEMEGALAEAKAESGRVDKCVRRWRGVVWCVL